MRFQNCILLAAGLAFCHPAQAADLDLRPTLPPSPASVEGSYSQPSSFYVRVDGGIGFNRRPELATLPNPVGTAAGSLLDPNYGGTYTDSTYTAARLNQSAFGGVGIGYQFFPWLRLDVTGEYRAGATLTATNVLNDVGATGGTAARNTTTSNFKGKLSSSVFLVNAYVDLGRYWGFTPFVGGGAGVSTNRMSRVDEAGSYSAQIDGVAPFGIPIGAYFPARTHTNFAWALMAGVAYDLTPNLKLEAGYRYLNRGSLLTGTENAYIPGGTVALPYYGRGRNISADDIKVGLRWNFSSVPLPDQALTRRY